MRAPRQGAEMAFLEMRQVEKRFGVIEVLRGLDLMVNEHQVVCLIGPSGCGKSTLLRCINGLETIQRGEILLSPLMQRSNVDLPQDRKSTRLNSSHGYISYAVFCLKKKK